jgi:metal-sulfur cluster biosynthetic enzyme
MLLRTFNNDLQNYLNPQQHHVSVKPMPEVPMAFRINSPVIITSVMLTESDILNALRDCYDPNLPCNIVDLGLVKSVTVAPDPDAPGAGIPGVPQKHRIHVEFTLTNPTEEAEAQLSAQMRNRLAGMEEAGETNVTFVREPAWSPQQITPAGRRILGLDGNSNLVQIR